MGIVEQGADFSVGAVHPQFVDRRAGREEPGTLGVGQRLGVFPCVRDVAMLVENEPIPPSQQRLQPFFTAEPAAAQVEFAPTRIGARGSCSLQGIRLGENWLLV